MTHNSLCIMIVLKGDENMKCQQCDHINLYKAKYCQKCGHQFSEKEIKDAYDHTIYGLLDKLEQLYYHLSLQTITCHPITKIATIVVILICGIGNIMQNGSEFSLLNSSHYRVSYNESLDEYYIHSNDTNINLQFYIPKYVDEIIIDSYDYNDQFLYTLHYKPSDAISLINDSTYHYDITAIDNNKKESITVYTFWGEQ